MCAMQIYMCIYTYMQIYMCAMQIYNESKYCHITPVLVVLHWLPVKFRNEFKILLIVFKILKGFLPSYLSF